MRLSSIVALTMLSVQIAYSQFILNNNSGLTDEQLGTNEAYWGDFNGDGNMDIFIINFVTEENPTTRSFFQNNGDGTFNQISDGVFANETSWNGQGAIVDYNNDGLLDIFINDYPNDFIFKNLGSFAFEQVELSSGAAGHSAWADYDNDGDLDYVTNNRRFFENNGDGTFIEILDNAFVLSTHNFYQMSWIDLNNDGFQDIVTTNDTSDGGGVFINNGDKSFTMDASHSLSSLSASLSHCWGDYNNDGYLDLFNGSAYGNGTNEFFENQGDGTFVLIENLTFLGENENIEASNWGDYDNDGNLDLFMATSTTYNFLFKGDGSGGFTSIENEVFNHGNSYSYSANWSDFNNDGYLDIFSAVSDTESTFSDADKNFLYENEGGEFDYIKINLLGIQSNSFGIGAAIKLYDNQRVQTRGIQSNGFSTSDMSVHFGLGSIFSVDSVIVMWPSQEKTIIRNLMVSDSYEIIEGSEYPIPQAPMGVEIVKSGTEDILQWMTVEEAVNYFVFEQVEGDEFREIDFTEETSTSAHIIDGEGRFNYFIVSLNSFGQHSFFSDTLEYTVPLNTPSGLTFSQTGLEVEVNWVDNSLKESNYIVEISDNEDFETSAREELPVDAQSFLMTDLNLETSYFVRVKAVRDDGLESEYSEVLDISIEPLSISESLEITIYPNPIEEEIRINNASAKTLSIRIYNSHGEYVESLEIEPGLQAYNLQLKSGIYFLLEKEMGFVQRVIKK